MTRAAIYTRVSSEAQADEDKVSLDEQARDIEAHCAGKGYTVTARYEDVESGVSRTRPGFRRLQADAMAGALDVVVAWKADRLARSGSAMGDLLDALEPHRVAVETVRETFDKRYAELMAAIARLERESIRERTAMGKRGAARQGRIPQGRPPFGYTIGADGRAEVVDDEADVVRVMFTMYAEGQRIQPIQAYAEAMTGRPWSSARAHKVLSRSAYKGRWTYEGIEVPFPAIVDEQTWDTVQRLKKSRRRKASGPREKHSWLLGKLVRCVCGSAMGGFVKQRSGKEPLLYYRCHGKQRGLGRACKGRSYVRADRLEPLVWYEVRDILTDADSFYNAVSGDDEDGSMAADLDAAQRDLAKVDTENNRLTRIYVSGVIPEAEYIHQRKYITERLETAQQRLDDLRAQQSAAHEMAAIADSITAWAQRIGAGLHDLDDGGRREVIRLVLEGVRLEDNGGVRLDVVFTPDSGSESATANSLSKGRSPRFR